MTRISPLAVLFLFGFVGIITHKLGLWLPFGILAMFAVAGAQRRRAVVEVAGDQQIATIPDVEPIAAFERTKHEPHGLAPDALLAEKERRVVDV